MAAVHTGGPPIEEVDAQYCCRLPRCRSVKGNDTDRPLTAAASCPSAPRAAVQHYLPALGELLDRSFRAVTTVRRVLLVWSSSNEILGEMSFAARRPGGHRRRFMAGAPKAMGERRDESPQRTEAKSPVRAR